MAESFGAALKRWRRIRRMSQMDLAMAAAVSTRHVAFLETGRARPSRGMVLRLSEAFGAPLSYRNALLTAAGFAPAFSARALSDAEMRPARAAVAWMLERHAPFPAFVLDGAWTLVDLNPPADALFASVGLDIGDNLLEALVANDALRGAIENLDEVTAHLGARLRTESAHRGGDPLLDRAIERLTAGPAATARDAASPPFTPTRYRIGDATLALVSTIAQFGAAEDIVLSNLRLELMFPADEATDAFLRALPVATR